MVLLVSEGRVGDDEAVLRNESQQQHTGGVAFPNARGADRIRPP